MNADELEKVRQSDTYYRIQNEMMDEEVFFKHPQMLFNDVTRETKLIYLRSAGYTKATSLYYAAHERELEHNLFEYIESGSGYIVRDGVTYPLKAGDFCIIRTNSRYEYYADKNDPYTKLWFSASGSFVDHMMDTFKVDNSVYVTSCDMSKPILALIQVLAYYGHDERRLMQSLLDVFYRACSTKQRLYEMPQVARVKWYIDQNLCGCGSVEEIAEKFNFSRRHLSRIFSLEYGMPVSQYILHQRLSVAERMLTESSYSVAEIATDLGFCNQNHFATIFKKDHGISPTEYRALYGNITTSHQQNTDGIEHYGF